MGTRRGRQGPAQAGDESSQCPAPCAGVWGVAVLAERCLTPVLGEGESRGTGPGSPVRGGASLSQDEILLGVHEPNLPSSGPGDHCRGSHETAAAMGEGTAHHLREKNPECSCCWFTRRGPKMVPGLTLPWCGCREPASATCQPWCSPATVPAGWARTQTHHQGSACHCEQQDLGDRRVFHGCESNSVNNLDSTILSFSEVLHLFVPAKVMTIYRLS